MSNLVISSNGFNDKMRDYLIKEKDFLDVTIACDDNQQIKAHKIILSAGSLFLRNILSNINHPLPYLYLGGVSKNNLQHIVEFIYTGSTNIEEDQVGDFIIAAQQLQVTGLENIDIINMMNNIEHDKNTDNHDILSEELTQETTKKEVDRESTATVDDKKIKSTDEFNEYELFSSMKEDEKSEIISLESSEKDKLKLEKEVIDELRCKLEKIVTKIGPMWQCKACGKKGPIKGELQRHAETHLGITHTCTLCGKILKSRHAYSKHIHYDHSEANSLCNTCGKSGMNKRQLQMHVYGSKCGKHNK